VLFNQEIPSWDRICESRLSTGMFTVEIDAATPALNSVGGNMIKFAVMSTKGGVGKTTLAANLGAALADIGLRTLLIDGDVQPSLSKYFKLRRQAPEGLSFVLKNQRVTEDCISNTVFPNLDIICSDDPMGMLQPWLASKMNSHVYLSNALASPYLTEDAKYECVVIDTQGAVGPLQNNAGIAASQILLPVVPEAIAAREFIGGTMELIRQLEPNPGARIGPVRAILNRMDRTSDAKGVADSLKEHFISLEGRVSLLKTVIPMSKAYKEAATGQIPVHIYERSRNGGQMLSAWDVMHSIVWELVPSFEGVVGTGFQLNDPNDEHSGGPV
jgi:chromosome partitioning related protein ParA